MRLRLVPALLSLLVLALLAVPATAATPPTVPFDSTADLFVAENGCDCLVMIAEDDTISVAATSAEIAGGDDDAAGAGDVDFSEAGVAVAADGTVYFVNDGTNSLLSYDLDGAIATVVSGTDFATVLADPDPGPEEGPSVDVEKLAFTSSGVLWGTEDSAGNVFSVDIATGAVSVEATDEDFEALPDVVDVQLSGGIAIDAAGQVYVGSDGAPDAVFGIAPDGTLSLVASEPNEVQSLVLDGSGGTFTLEFDGETTDPVTVGAAAADVLAALEALANIATGDVAVAGTGTTTDPYRVTFMGSYAGTDTPSITISTTGFTGSTDVNQDVRGGNFNDLDVYATLDGDGVLVIGDDSPATIFRIAADGSEQALVVDTQIDGLTSGDDVEGGIAYDEDGILYISEEDSDNILSFDGSTLSIRYAQADFEAVTGSEPDLDGGIAFRMPIVDLSPTIDAPTEAVPGELLTSTVTVTNDGPNTVDGFTVSTPEDLEAPSIAAPDGFDGSLAPGDSAVFTITGTVPSGATGTFDVMATTAPSLGAIDTDTSNDTDTAAIALTPAADLAMTLIGTSALAHSDQTATFAARVTNEGPSDARDVTVVMELGDALSPDAALGSGWTCSDDGGATVTCTRAVLEAGATSEIVVEARTQVLCVDFQDRPGYCTIGGFTEATTLITTATVTTTTPDPDSDNDVASASTDVADPEIPAVDDSEDDDGDDRDDGGVAADDEDLPAAGASLSQTALFALIATLLGAVLLQVTGPAFTGRRTGPLGL